MRRILLILAVSLLALGAAAQNPRQSYIEQYYPLAVLEMQRTGVPASITLAQALLESSAGQSPLATQANNHFGMKCHNDWTGETFHKDDDQADECFRVYPTVVDSYRAHSDFLRNRDRYASLFDLDPTDYKGWAKGLRRAGYATDPSYANKLINLIEDFQLYRFDQMTENDLPSGAVASAALAELPEAASEPAAPVSAAPVQEQLREQSRPVEAPVTVRTVPIRETVSLSLVREVHKTNGVRYVRSVEGESWASLAAEYHLSLKRLLSFNDLSSPEFLAPGSIVYLERKKAENAPGQGGLYEVPEDGLTLWDISQMFGIQLSKLMLYNGFRSDMVLEAGDTVILRKL